MALAAAAHDRQRVRAVISESAQPYVEERTLEGVRAAQARFAEAGQIERLRRWHGERAEWVLRAWIDTWLDEQRLGWRLSPQLAQVHCPVLVLHGDQDEFGSPRFASTIAEEVGGPSECHILAGVGHVPHRQSAEQVIASVQRFLATHAVG